MVLVAAAKLAMSAARKKFGTVDALLLFRRGIGIDHGAGFVLRWPQDRLHAAVAELIEIAGGDILELREQRARLRPGRRRWHKRCRRRRCGRCAGACNRRALSDRDSWCLRRHAPGPVRLNSRTARSRSRSDRFFRRRLWPDTA